MGKTLFDLMLLLFSTPHNAWMGAEWIVAEALSRIGLTIGLLIISVSIIWLMVNSVLLRKLPFLYSLLGTLVMVSIHSVSHFFVLSSMIHQLIEMLTTISVSITAIWFWLGRHFVLGVIYRFKYMIGVVNILGRED